MRRDGLAGCATLEFLHNPNTERFLEVEFSRYGHRKSGVFFIWEFRLLPRLKPLDLRPVFTQE